MKKKTVMTFLMTMLVGVMLAGCGKKEETVESENTVVQEEPEPEETAEPEPEPEPESEPEPEPEPPKPYVEENGLEFFQGTSLTTKGIRYNPDAVEDFDVIDIDVEITGATAEDAEQEGYQLITVEVAQTGLIWSEAASGYTNNKLSMMCNHFSVCDMYTGRMVPGASLNDEASEMQYTTDLEWEGESYSIGYSKSMQSVQGEWSGDFCPMTQHVTYHITVPKEYDGLTLLMCPLEEYKEFEAGVVDEEEEYIIDEEWSEAACLIRVSDLLAEFEN